MAMVRNLGIDLNALRNRLLSKLSNSEVTLISTEGVNYLSIRMQGNLLFDLRITDLITEAYIGLGLKGSEEVINTLSDFGLQYIGTVVNELQSRVKYLPKSLIISWSKPSDTIYVLLEPSTNFPPVKGSLRGNEVTVITPSCIVRGEDVGCSDEVHQVIAGVVIKLLKELSKLSSN